MHRCMWMTHHPCPSLNYAPKHDGLYASMDNPKRVQKTLATEHEEGLYANQPCHSGSV